MSVTQITPEQNSSSEARCTHCNSPLPPHALFCRICGKRVDKGMRQAQTSENTAGVAQRYHITSLLRRRPHMQLFLAIDTLYQRPIGIRDIDISLLDDDAQAKAIQAFQEEYDLLRLQRVPDVMPIIDMRYLDGHIFTVAGWPFPLDEWKKDDNSGMHVHTLEDLLQSGIGLPDEQVALAWVYRLCTAVAHLHNLNIVVGDIDPASIVVSNSSYTGQPALTVSWLPPSIHALLSNVSSLPENSTFNAPEVRRGAVEPHSDIYSLGALLYLLLTGTPLDETDPWMHNSFRKLQERNVRVTKGTEALIKRALSIDPSDRFQSADEMREALLQQIASVSNKKRERLADDRADATQNEHTQNMAPGADVASDERKRMDDTGDITTSVVPLHRRLAQWQLVSSQLSDAGLQDRSAAIETIDTIVLAKIPPVEQEIHQELAETPLPSEATISPAESGVLSEQVLPVPQTSNKGIEAKPVAHPSKRQFRSVLSTLPRKIQPEVPSTSTSVQPSTPTEKPSFLKRLQRFVLGEQRRRIMAAAFIETPLRVQPNQSYTIRIHVMGRDEPTVPTGATQGTQPVGLSSIKRDEAVHIEVRSAIYQNYAYIVQRADVSVPGKGYAAEVTIPMQPLSGGPNGRRERLHIFFMDEMRQPLYENPFVVEVFVSSLVPSGREGHNVLSIPF